LLAHRVISGLSWVGTFAVTLVAKRPIAWFTASNGSHLKVTVLRTATYPARWSLATMSELSAGAISALLRSLAPRGWEQQSGVLAE
jgi:hypothetical protein